MPGTAMHGHACWAAAGHDGRDAVAASSHSVHPRAARARPRIMMHLWPEDSTAAAVAVALAVGGFTLLLFWRRTALRLSIEKRLAVHVLRDHRGSGAALEG